MRPLSLAFLVLLACLVTLPAADPAPTVTTPEGRVLTFDPDWTPRPQEGDVPAYVKETDVDWVDDRLRRMDTGRTFNATFKYQHNGTDVTVYKGTAIRVGEKGEAAWLYDRNQLRWCCAWECEPLQEPTAENPTGFTPYLNHSDRRFGLLNTPTPKGEMVFSGSLGSDWSDAQGRWSDRGPATAPMPVSDGRHAEIMRWNDATVMLSAFPRFSAPGERVIVKEIPWATTVDGRSLLTRLIETDGPLPHHLRLLSSLTRETNVERKTLGRGKHTIIGCRIEFAQGPLWMSVAISQSQDRMVEFSGDDVPMLAFTGRKHPRALVCLSRDPGWTLESLIDATSKIAPTEDTAEWFVKFAGLSPAAANPLTVETRGERGTDAAAYVVDTLTLPYDNPWRALFFASGVEFVPRSFAGNWAGPEGPDLAVLTTVHGDVWLIDGVDEDLQQLRWKRFATGLYQPLGVKVVRGELMVLERGQLTVLQDRNQDGCADVYGCFCGDWHIGGGEHSYHTSLETDLQGNFYFHAGGDTNTPTGGSLIKVLADGSRSEVYCTGFRHPIGLGSLPDGRITGADQEGNWMPSTRLDIYKQGGFYGDMRAHHRDVEPTTYDGPLCWIPRQVDGSAGGEVFVNRDDFGPLSGQLLHMSYGNCSLMLVLRQEHAGIEQAGVYDLGLRFLAGVQRGRFRDSDGCLYLAGMDGWQTAAQADGCLQRVRYTGKPAALPTGLTLENGGIKLQFSVPIARDLDGASSSVEGRENSVEELPGSQPAADPRRYHVELWDYLWSKEYGSKRYSVEHPGQEGQDVLMVESATVLDPWTVFLKVRGLRPAMQAQIEFDLLAYADDAGPGERLKGSLYSTIHTTGPALELQDGERIALIGGTLIEREQRYGYWEHAITAAHPDKSLTFRNLGWSGDTVWSDSRGIFDPADKGYARLLEQVQELRPTLFVLNYGGNEAWESLQGGEPVETAINRFITQYGKLIDDLSKPGVGDLASKPGVGDAGSPPRFVLLTPLPMEPGVGPNADPAVYNAHLARYAAAIEALAHERSLPCINLAVVHRWYESQVAGGITRRPLTDNGLHLSAYGYWRTAEWFRERLCAGTSAPSLELPTAADAIALISRFDASLQQIVVEPLTAEQLQVESPIVEFRGCFSRMPLPTLGEEAPLAPSQRYQLRSPGTYRMDVDGETAARGPAAKWSTGLPYTAGPDARQSQQLLTAIRRKNELYFHRWRPQNVTYLFLFRKHEQGNNAVEIPQFDPLIAAEEARIAELKIPQTHRYQLIREPDR